MGRLTLRRPAVRIDLVDPGARPERVETLAVEEPLELRVNGAPWVVTMRTPGHDVELAHGLLWSEGIISAVGDVVSARYCAGSVADADGVQANTYNVLDLALAPGVRPPAPRATLTTSACGVCGQASIEALRVRGRFDVGGDAVAVPAGVLAGLPDALRREQRVFAATGGVHAAGVFTAAGVPVVVREDVGRHNAVDKVVGWALLQGKLPWSGHVLQVSGRASFELVQKAYLAGLPVLSAVSAPSSLAVALASEVGVCLAGFVRESRLTLYARPERIAAATHAVTPG